MEGRFQVKKLTLAEVEKRLVALGCTNMDRKPRASGGFINLPNGELGNWDFRDLLSFLEGNPTIYGEMYIEEATSADFDLSVLEQSPLEDRPIISMEECAAIDSMLEESPSQANGETAQYQIDRGLYGWENVGKTVINNIVWWDMGSDYSGGDQRLQMLEQLRNGETVESYGIGMRLLGIDHGWEEQGYSLRGADCAHEYIGMRNNGDPVCLECARIVSHFNVNVPRIANRDWDQLWGENFAHLGSGDRLYKYLETFLVWNDGMTELIVNLAESLPTIDPPSYWQVDQYGGLHNGEFSGEVIATYATISTSADPRIALLSFLQEWRSMAGDWFDDVPLGISVGNLIPHYDISKNGETIPVIAYSYKYWAINSLPISQNRAAYLPTLAGVPRVSMAGNPPDSEIYYRSHRVCAYANGGMYLYAGIGLQNETVKALINSALKSYSLPYELCGFPGEWILICRGDFDQFMGTRGVYSGMFLSNR